MEVSALAEQVAADLEALGALGDETTVGVAHRLAAAMQPSLRVRLLGLLEQAVAEISTSLPEHRVEVRLVGGDARFVVESTGGAPAPAAPSLEGDADARLTLRLPTPLKARLEAEASRESLSLNSYILRSLRNQLSGAGQAPLVGRRLRGQGRS